MVEGDISARFRRAILGKWQGRKLDDGRAGFGARNDRRCAPTLILSAAELAWCLRSNWLEVASDQSLRWTQCAVRSVSTSAGEPYETGRQSRERRKGEADRVIGECPVDWLWARGGTSGFLSKAEYVAACRYRSDHEAAQAGLIAGIDWQAPARDKHCGTRVDMQVPSERASGARNRVRRMEEALGPALTAIARRSCLEPCSLADWERREGWPQRSGKLAVKLALQRLSEIQERL